MEFTFEKDKNYFKCYDEARGVAMNKKYILKNKKLNLFSYTDYMYLIFGILFFLSIIFILSKDFDIFMLGILLMIVDILFLFGVFISTYIMYNFCRKRKMPLKVLIDKNGITNSSYYDIKMIFKWEKILGIVVKKNSITILTDTPIYFYFDKSCEKKLIKEIKKYKKDITIIRDKKKSR